MLQCEDQGARGYEWELRRRLYHHEHLRDDTVISKNWHVGKSISNTGWGIQAEWIDSEMGRGAGTFKPVIESQKDLDKLRHPEVVYDEAASLSNLEQAQDVFGDILDVQLKGIRTISFHLMNIYTHLRGLDQVMMDMYTEPQMLHDAMSFLTEGYEKLIDQYVEMNLLSLNNEDGYIYPAGNG